MDRSEPTLIPEWLKSSGSAGGGGNNQSSSFLHSEDHFGSRHARHKSSSSSKERNIGRSFVPDQTTSSYFRRSTSTKESSDLRSLGSVSRYYHDREWDSRRNFRDEDESVFGEHTYTGNADCPADVLVGKSNKDILRHSKSMTSRKSDVTLSRKGSGDLIDGSNNNHVNSSGLLLPRGSVPSSTQAALGKDFPTLSFEQEQGSSELRRTPSPGMATVAPSSPNASSNMIVTEGWSSSLAEVPGPVGSSSTGNLPYQQTVSPRSAPLAQHANALNMAEAVMQNPTRARTFPQLPVDTQRLEELAIKQSRQLIPVTPPMLKPFSLSPLDKSKSKTMQQSPFLPSRLDAAKTPNPSKLQILKSPRETNGVSSAVKDRVGPRNGFHIPLSQTPSGASAASSPNRKNNTVNSQTVAVPDRRTVAPSPGNLEKRLSPQIQSRRDFLNLIKKQSSGTTLTARADNSPSVLENSNDSIGEVVAPEALASVVLGRKQDLPVPNFPIENGCKTTENGECIENGGKTTENGECHGGAKNSYSNVPPPDEKEAEFLRSLGWEETEGEDEGLTEEEIRSFYEHIKTTLPSELPRLQLVAVNGSSSSNSSEQ